ncbi:MAG TPA: CHRD domain-containing protein [Bacteroidota bacterium]
MRSMIQACAFVLLSGLAYGQIPVIAAIDGQRAGTSSLGRGTLVGEISSDMKTFTYRATYARLEGAFTQAHFHSALSGGVVHPITFVGNTATGTWSDIPDSLGKNFVGGNIYINIHSSAALGGEIAGTLNLHQNVFSMELDSSGTGGTSTARGTGYAILAEDGSGNIDYRMTFAGLAGSYTNGHFHSLPVGGIVHGFTTSDSATISGTWASPPDSAYSLFLRGSIYANIHSSAAPGGEIRGIAVPKGEFAYVGTIDGTQAGTGSSAQGTVWAVLNATDLSVRYHATYAQLQGSFTQAHFHTSNGNGIVHGVTFAGNTTSTDTWTSLTDANLQDFLKERIYLNIHSSTAPGGEIRGNLIHQDGAFVASLDGAQASTSSTAKGTGWLILNEDTVQYRITIAGLNGTFTNAHFHYVPTTGVIQAITFSDSNAVGNWAIQDSIVYHLIKGNIYINVHSSVAPGGEIRGNIKIGLGPVTSVGENPETGIPDAFALSQNYPNPFNPSTKISFTLQVSGFTSLKIFDLLGREVATLLNEVLQPGGHEVTWEASRFPSGVYFCRLETGDGITQMRKMLLIR